MEVAQKQNIVSQWVSWQFLEMPRNILVNWKNFLKFNLNFFSLPLLFKTFFAPWRRYRFSQGRGFDLPKYLEVIFSNLIFRILGAIIKSFVIIIGLAAEVFIVLAGIIIFIGWLILPALLVAGFIFGLSVIL